jgi:prepilin peptidase CpaA
MIDFLGLAIIAGLLVFSALHDLCFRTIPNWVSLAVLGIGLLVRFNSGQFLASILAVAIVFVLLFFCWLRGWIGGGDMKLLSAVSAAVPPSMSPTLVIVVALAGGVLGLFYLLVRPLVARPVARRPGDSLARRVLKTEARRVRRGGPLPYAMAILAGAVITMWGI